MVAALQVPEIERVEPAPALRWQAVWILRLLLIGLAPVWLAAAMLGGAWHWAKRARIAIRDPLDMGRVISIEDQLRSLGSELKARQVWVEHLAGLPGLGPIAKTVPLAARYCALAIERDQLLGEE